MPKVGARIIKTAVAVLLCLLIEYIISPTPMMYSVIAAIICMQRGMQDSIAMSVERVLGTIFGGLTGSLLALLFRMTPGMHVLLQYVIVSAAIIPVIYLSVTFKRERSVALIAIVFLSTAIVPAEGSPFLSSMITTADTVLGIIVALLVNLVHPAPPEPEAQGPAASPGATQSSDSATPAESEKPAQPLAVHPAIAEACRCAGIPLPEQEPEKDGEPVPEAQSPQEEKRRDA